MKLLKRNELIPLQQDITKNLKPNERILKQFPVIPVDYNVVDYSSPILFLTTERLIFSYDTTIETYELVELEITMKGEKPNFELLSMFLEKGYLYSRDSIREIKSDENITEFSIREQSGIPKDFMLRNGLNAEKSYKTWAMYQMIFNQKNGMAQNETVEEMIGGYFSRFNSSTIFLFAVLFIAYFVVKIVSLNYFPDLVDNIFDWIFVAILLWMSYWLYLSVDKNMKRFKGVYMTYVTRK